MMPVIRVSDETWKRLQEYARPFEDKPEDIVIKALDALDEKKGRVLTLADITDVGGEAGPVTAPAKRGTVAKKLPQKEFRNPLMETLRELGGKAHTSDIRRIMEEKMKPHLNAADYEFVSSGDPRWWNAICWERNTLVNEGLFAKDSKRGIWELSVKGKRYLDRKT